MRWGAAAHPPRDGDFRTVRRFLWLPRTLDCETRWLETANIVQAYHVEDDPSSGYFWCGWVDHSWAEET